MGIEDCLAVIFGLVGKIIHKDCQANASAAEKLNNWRHHEGQYLWRTFKTEGKDLPFV